MKKVISTALAFMMLVCCVSIALSVSAANICDVMGHSYGEWTVVQPGSCNSNGLQTKTCEYCHDMQSQVLPMDPNYHASKSVVGTNGDGTHTMVCNGCGKELSSPCIADGWTHNDETGMDESECVICHGNFSAECVYDIYPSATAGKHTYICSQCAEKREEACAFTPVKTVDPTCEKNGTITYSCKCGSNYTEVFAPATGHTDANSDGVCDTCSAQLTAPKQEESKSFLDTIREFFQKIIDWFNSLFK